MQYTGRSRHWLEFCCRDDAEGSAIPTAGYGVIFHQAVQQGQLLVQYWEEMIIIEEAQRRKQQVVSELSKLCRFVPERHTTYCHFISNGKSLMFYDIF